MVATLHVFLMKSSMEAIPTPCACQMFCWHGYHLSVVMSTAAQCTSHAQATALMVNSHVLVCFVVW